jgi:hypothetical protein
MPQDRGLRKEIIPIQKCKKPTAILKGGWKVSPEKLTQG